LETLLNSGKILTFTKNKIARFNWKEIKKEYPNREKLQLLRFLGRSKCKRKFYENKLILKNGLLKEIGRTFNKYNNYTNANSEAQQLLSQCSTKNDTNSFRTSKNSYSNKFSYSSSSPSKKRTNDCYSNNVNNNINNTNNNNNSKVIQVPLEESFYKEAKRLYEKDGILVLNKERISCILYNFHFSNYFNAKA